MSTAATIEEINTRCILGKEHPSIDHTYILPIHKCQEDNCGWCPDPNDRCTYKFITFQIWLNMELK